jgi:hypothetical protein
MNVNLLVRTLGKRRGVRDRQEHCGQARLGGLSGSAQSPG